MAARGRAQKRPAAPDRAKARRERKLRKDLEQVQAHLEHLARQRAEIQQALRANAEATSQMTGRSRYILEELGQAEPLHDPPVPPEEPEE